VAIRIAPGFDEKFKKIREVMMLPPPPPPVTRSVTIMPATQQILSSARSPQSNASAFRIGKTITFSSPGNNSKVTGILQERQHARTVAHQGDHLIGIVASLWKVDGSLKAQRVCLTQSLLQFASYYYPGH
jgi:hypothetical protein